MKTRKKIAAVIVALIVIGLAAFGTLRWLRGNKQNVIRVSGNIELTEVKIGFKMAGKLTRLTVDEGDPVKKGMVIASLDKAQLEQQRNRDAATLAGAKARLQELYTAIEYQRATIESQIEQRQAELNTAQAQLDKLLSGSRRQEIAQAKAAVMQAQAQLDRAASDWKRAQQLYRNGDISTAQYDQARTQYESAAAMLKQTKEKTALVIVGPRREDIDAARAQVSRAKAALQTARASRLDLKRMEQDVQVRRADIDRAKAQVAMDQTQLDDAVAKSPIDGVVLVKAAEIGEILAPGTTVLTIGDLDHPWLRGYINERDLGLVKYGQEVKVTSDSFPGKIYHGRISFISSEAEFTPKQIQTAEERVKLVYRIKIDIDNRRHELKLNMPVDARIEISAAPEGAGRNRTGTHRIPPQNRKP